MMTHPISILLAEDDDGHASLVETNLRRAGMLNIFIRARDGQETMDILEKNENAQEFLPHGPVMLLLDINMPRMGGIEVLERIKKSPTLCHIPVIMLTTTDSPREVQTCYELGCNVYITKPVEYESFVESIRRLGMFLQIVQVSPKST